MEKETCPRCGKTLHAPASVCPACEREEHAKIVKETSDKDAYYFTARDYSAPENYPGY